MNYNLELITNQFNIDGAYLSAEPIVAGHINDTFLVNTNGDKHQKYILQRINHAIFKNVPELQNNILKVTNHIKEKLLNNNVLDIDRKIITLIPAKDKKWFINDNDGNYWRMMLYIEGSHSYNQLSSPKLAYDAGLAFGEFDAMLADLPGEPLFDTIKDFHNMEFRLQQFKDAIQNNVAIRLDLVIDEIKEIEKRTEEMTLINRLGREGKLPKRIIHCDTKINNVLFDADENILCIIDLDTVMSGYITSDFGDAIRTGANTGAEDDINLNNVSMSIELFEAYAKGFLKGTASFITQQEIDCLALSAKMFAYMQAVRFLTDYLNDDIYYKINHKEHNLQRTKAQLKLLYSMEVQYDKMCKIIKA